MTVPKHVKTDGVLGGSGLDAELRDNRSVCNKHYVVTTDGTDLCIVLERRDNIWFTLLHVNNTVTVEHVRRVGLGNGFKRAILANLYGKQCCLCGETKDQMSIDHVIPRAVDGWSSLDNLQLMCQPCNNKKDSSWADYRFMTPSEIFELWFEKFIMESI